MLRLIKAICYRSKSTGAWDVRSVGSRRLRRRVVSAAYATVASAEGCTSRPAWTLCTAGEWNRPLPWIESDHRLNRNSVASRTELWTRRGLVPLVLALWLPASHAGKTVRLWCTQRCSELWLCQLCQLMSAVLTCWRRSTARAVAGGGGNCMWPLLNLRNEVAQLGGNHANVRGEAHGALTASAAVLQQPGRSVSVYGTRYRKGLRYIECIYQA